MNISIKWLDEEHTIIYVEYPIKWEWSDYHQSIDACIVLLRSVNYPVDIITNIPNPNWIPPGSVLQQFDKALELFQQPNFRHYVMVSTGILLRTFLDLFYRIFKTRFQVTVSTAYTLEAAVNRINQLRRNNNH